MRKRPHESDAHYEWSQTLDLINNNIKKVFAKHGFKPVISEEEMEIMTIKITRKNKPDGKYLQTLYKNWDNHMANQPDLVDTRYEDARDEALIESRAFNITSDNDLNPSLKKEIQGVRGLIWENIPKIKNKRFKVSKCPDKPAVIILDTITGHKTEPVGLCNLHGAIQILNQLFMEVVKEIKSYKEVKVGDTAYQSPDAGGEWNKEIGPILWKGPLDKLLHSAYKDCLDDWEDVVPMADQYDLVIVNTKGWDSRYTLYNYNNDPSGCVCFKPLKKKSKA